MASPAASAPAADVAWPSPEAQAETVLDRKVWDCMGAAFQNRLARHGRAASVEQEGVFLCEVLMRAQRVSAAAYNELFRPGAAAVVELRRDAATGRLGAAPFAAPLRRAIDCAAALALFVLAHDDAVVTTSLPRRAVDAPQLRRSVSAWQRYTDRWAVAERAAQGGLR